MKMSTRAKLILAGVCVLLGLFAWKLHAARQTDSPTKTQWEYIILAVPEHGRQDEMNKVGAQGWELIHVRRVVETFGLRLRTLLERGITPDIHYEYIFKRPR